MLRATTSLSRQQLLKHSSRKAWSRGGQGVKGFSSGSSSGRGRGGGGSGVGSARKEDVSKEFSKIGVPTYSDPLLDRAYEDSQAPKHDAAQSEWRQAMGMGRGGGAQTHSALSDARTGADAGETVPSRSQPGYISKPEPVYPQSSEFQHSGHSPVSASELNKGGIDVANDRRPYAAPPTYEPPLSSNRVDPHSAASWNAPSKRAVHPDATALGGQLHPPQPVASPSPPPSAASYYPHTNGRQGTKEPPVPPYGRSQAWNEQQGGAQAPIYQSNYPGYPNQYQDPAYQQASSKPIPKGSSSPPIPNQKKPALSENAYHRMVAAYQKAGRNEELARTLQEMQSVGYSLRPEFKITLLQAQINLGQVDAAESTLNDIQNLGVVVNPSIYNSMVEMYAELGEIEKMERMVEFVRESEPHHVNTTNQPQGHSGQQQLFPQAYEPHHHPGQSVYPQTPPAPYPGASHYPQASPYYYQPPPTPPSPYPQYPNVSQPPPQAFNYPQYQDPRYSPPPYPTSQPPFPQTQVSYPSAPSPYPQVPSPYPQAPPTYSDIQQTSPQLKPQEYPQDNLLHPQKLEPQELPHPSVSEFEIPAPPSPKLSHSLPTVDPSIPVTTPTFYPIQPKPLEPEVPPSETFADAPSIQTPPHPSLSEHLAPVVNGENVETGRELVDESSKELQLDAKSDSETIQTTELSEEERKAMRERMRKRQSLESEIDDSQKISMADGRDVPHEIEMPLKTELELKAEVVERICESTTEPKSEEIVAELSTKKDSVPEEVSASVEDSAPEVVSGPQTNSPEELAASTQGIKDKVEIQSAKSFMDDVDTRPKLHSFMASLESDFVHGSLGRGKGGDIPPSSASQRKIGKPSEVGDKAHKSKSLPIGSAKISLPPMTKEEATERALSVLMEGQKRERERMQLEKDKSNQEVERQREVEQGTEDLKTEPKPSLTNEEAAERAVSILIQGRDKARGSRRSSIIDFANDVFSSMRRTGTSESKPGGSEVSRTVRERTQRQRPPRKKKAPVESEEFHKILQSLEPENEEEAKDLEVLKSYFDMENSVERQLHFTFMRHFEPEYMMEDFGKNPDINDTPPPSLKEYLNDVKAELLQRGEIDEDDWDEGVKDVLNRAEILEALTEKYTGPQRVTARQECNTLSEIAASLPLQESNPEFNAFTTRALRSLQSNPSWTFEQKTRMLTNIVNSLASKSPRQPSA